MARSGDRPQRGREAGHNGARPLAILLATLLLAACNGCWSSTANEVVVYTAQDDEFAEPIYAQFTRATGIPVRPKYDTESTKTVGLAEAIRQERARPRCDVFWNNELLNTLRLEREGLLDVYRPAIAQTYPPQYRSAAGTWCGFAARARVLVVNRERLKEKDRPGSILDLADPRWRGRAGMAKPLFGTTASHVACLFALWGDDKARDFLRRVKENRVEILSGNKQVALAVAAGRLDFGVTDTDDAHVEISKGSPLEIIYPDQRPGAMGTLFIPNTVAVIRGGPHPEAARRLVAELLSPRTEDALARCLSAQIPLGAGATAVPPVATPKTVRAMAVDFAAAAEKWPAAARFVRDEFTGGE